MSNAIKSVFIAITVLFLLGCASTEPVPDNSFYRLTGEINPTPLEAPAISGTVVIERVKAFGILRERALLYSKEDSPEAIKQHHYHHWSDSPTVLIREQLLTYLRKRNIAQHVAIQERSQGGDYRLRIELKQLERMLNNDGGVTVRVTLEAELKSSEKNKPLLIKSYSLDQTAGTKNVLASVRLMDDALREIYSQLSLDIESVSLH